MCIQGIVYVVELRRCDKKFVSRHYEKTRTCNLRLRLFWGYGHFLVKTMQQRNL